MSKNQKENPCISQLCKGVMLQIIMYKYNTFSQNLYEVIWIFAKDATFQKYFERVGVRREKVYFI